MVRGCLHGIVAGILSAGVALAAPCPGTHWLGVWAASPSDATALPLDDQTLRLIVRPTFGGTRVRIRFSNRYGTAPVTIGAARVATHDGDGRVVPRSSRRLRFGRASSVVIPPGGEVTSDPRRFPLAAFRDIAVTLHVATSGPLNQHLFAFERSYLTPTGSGDHTRDVVADAFTSTIASWPLVTDVEVRAPRRVAAIVTVGDSITDGAGSPIGGNQRYPDILARRLADADGPRFAVQNAGISGNQVTRDADSLPLGPSLVTRLDADVIDQAGALVAIVMEGTNDLGLPPARDAATVIAGLTTVVERLRASGFRTILGTQAPAKATIGTEHGSEAAIAARNAVNNWIRTSGVADGVVDFHAALRAPDDADALHPAFDSGDGLHPNAAGYEAMANAIDLDLFASVPCR